MTPFHAALPLPRYAPSPREIPAATFVFETSQTPRRLRLRRVSDTRRTIYRFEKEQFLTMRRGYVRFDFHRIRKTEEEKKKKKENSTARGEFHRSPR